MGIISILLIAVGLAMDSLAVSISGGIVMVLSVCDNLYA